MGLATLLVLPSIIGAVHASGETLPRSDRERAREALRQLFPERPPQPELPQEAPPPVRPATAEDVLWGEEFGLPSCDGELFCAIRFGEDIVVGGSFRQIGGVAASNIARWDGARWHPLNQGVDGSVTSLAVYQGALYVGGRIYRAGGQPVYNLAKWNGQWSSVLNSPYPFYCCSETNALSVFRGELIASGYAYTPVGYGFGLAAWNGSTWRWLTTPIEGRVLSMQAVGDSLYVGGQFSQAGGVRAASVALWNGSAWSPVGNVGTADPYAYSAIACLAYYHGRLYAAGAFDSIGGQHIEGIAAWDGSTWSSLADHEIYGASAMAVCNDTLNISTFEGIERWDGSTWSSLPAFNGYARQLLPDDRSLIALGGGARTQNQNGTPRGLGIVRWDGTSWRDYETWNAHMRGLGSFGGGPGLIRALAPFQDDLIAAGSLTYFGTGTGWGSATPVMRWDGSSWAPMPFTSGEVTSLAERSDTLYAAGVFYTGGTLSSSAAARWTGNQWTSMDTLGINGVQLLSYSGRLVLATARYWFLDRASGVYEWSGSSWVPLGLVSAQDQGIVSMVEHKGELIVAGQFTSIGGIPAQGVAAWNGQSWRPLSFGFANFTAPPITGLASYNGRLFASGSFSDSPYGNRSPLVEWNGTAWIPVMGVGGDGRHVNIVGGRLLLSGDMVLHSTREQLNALLWDGRTWRSLGSGTNGAPYASAEYRGSLYVGGSFSRAGGKSAFGIARWNGLTSPAAQTPALSAGRPNPFSGAADFSYDLRRDSDVRITVHDAQGRLVVFLFAGPQPAGTHLIHWDGRDRLGRMASAGIYFVSIEDKNGAVSSRKIVRLR